MTKRPVDRIELECGCGAFVILAEWEARHFEDDCTAERLVRGAGWGFINGNDERLICPACIREGKGDARNIH